MNNAEQEHYTFKLSDNVTREKVTFKNRYGITIARENAHSRYFSEDAYKAANEPKELMIIPGAVHTDLYDKTDLIPFDKLESFFSENLK